MTSGVLPFPTDLPIGSVLADICSQLARCHELVLQAEPGAGKTTIVPLALLNEPWLEGKGLKGKIIVLEPRRMAARAAALRMAELLGESVGQTVGYRVRLDTRVSAATRIEVVTEGILIRLLQDDPALSDVGLVIFDEFHERSLDADFGLALSLQGRSLFREADNPLKILVMSATLECQAVAAMMGDAPVISCEGRTFPVAVNYSRPMQTNDNIVGPVVNTICDALAKQHGSILVFLPGQREITRVAKSLSERLQGSAFQTVTIAPLYGGLSLAEQQRAIQPVSQGDRKIVLATNVDGNNTPQGYKILKRRRKRLSVDSQFEK